MQRIDVALYFSLLILIVTTSMLNMLLYGALIGYITYFGGAVILSILIAYKSLRDLLRIIIKLLEEVKHG